MIRHFIVLTLHVTVLFLFAVSAQESDTVETVKPDHELIDTEISSVDSVDEAVPEPASTEPEPVHTEKERDISGTIIDKESGQPIASVTVKVPNTGISVQTDKKGKYDIKKVPQEALSLVVTAPGYKTRTLSLENIEEGKDLDITLSSSSEYELSDLDVTAERIEVKQMVKPSEHISKIELSPELLAKLPSIGSPDIFRSLQLLPGISASNEKSSGLYVRGGTPDQNLILLDGLPIYFVDHFFGFFSAFNANSIEEVQMHKGAFGAKYGGRVSSVVELFSKNTQDIVSEGDIGIKIGGGLGLLGADLHAQVPIVKNDKATLFMAGRRALTDVFKNRLYESIFNSVEGNDTVRIGPRNFENATMEVIPTFHFSDLNVIGTVKPNDNTLVSSSVYWSRDFLKKKIDTTTTVIRSRANRTDTSTTFWDESTESRWGTTGASLNWRQNWTDVYQTKATITYSAFYGIDKYSDGTYTLRRRQNNQNNPNNQNLPGQELGENNNHIWDYTGSINNSFKLGPFNNVDIGLEGQKITIGYNNIQPNRTRKEKDDAWAVSGYVQDELRLFDEKLCLIPGVRGTYYKLSDDILIDPRVMGWYKITKPLKVKAAWGLYSQYVQRITRESVFEGNDYFWLLSNDDYYRPVSVSQQIVAGFSFDLPWLMVDIEGYYKALDNILMLSDRNEFRARNELRDDQLNLFSGTGISRGVECLLQLKNIELKNLKYNGWLAYTLGQSVNTFPDINNGESFPAMHDQTHEIKLINLFTLDIVSWCSVDLSTVFIYATGLPYTAPLGRYEITMLDNTSRELIDVSSMNEYRLPDYHRFDMSTTYNVHFGRFNANIGGSIFNLYNNKNVVSNQFSEDEILDPLTGNMVRTGDYTAKETKSIRLLPNFSINMSVTF
jgi:hypothetical protein